MLITDYKLAPKHLIAVDCIIFGYEKNDIKLLLAKRSIEPQKGDWSLVGGWVYDDESVEDAARRVLKTITGLENIYMEQVLTFSDPNRDSGGRVISIAFYALIRIDAQDNDLVKQYGASWVSLKKHPKLIFDHNEMIFRSLEKLRRKASYTVLGKELLADTFTILQLRKLYDAIFFKKFDPGNFRKKILSLKVLERLENKNTTESKKGAFYYRFSKNQSAQNLNPIIKTF